MKEVQNIEKDLKEVLHWINNCEELKGRAAEGIAKENLDQSMLQLLKDVEQLRAIVNHKFNMTI